MTFLGRFYFEKHVLLWLFLLLWFFFVAIATETIARYIPAPLPGGGSPLSREHLKEIHAPPTRFKYFCTYKNI